MFCMLICSLLSSHHPAALCILLLPSYTPFWRYPFVTPQQPNYSTTYVSGVDDGKSGSHYAPQVAVQSGKLPEIIIRGQAGSNPQACGSLVLKDVGALFSKTGGLDISLYSAGMVCIDLLSRMQVVLDYPNKRIGWKVPPQQQQQQQQQDGVGVATAVATASSSSS
jgi:hypothetical protein